MSAKTNAKNSNNDWEDEDDNGWDDWGDAEDNFPQTIAAKSNEEQNEDIPISSKSSQCIELKKSSSNEIANDVEKDSQSEKHAMSWGSMWGGMVSSVLSTATEGLGNISTTMSQGLHQVIGVPDPEEMARINAAVATKSNENQETDEGGEMKAKTAITDSSKQSSEGQTATTPVFGLNLVSGVTTLGSKVLNTGLDTLEGIGKKTMNILQENDPKLINKRKMLGLDAEKPNLSEVLKEAKTNADQLEHTLKELQVEKSKKLLCFETLFENNCGLVHLEALEILSKESALKIKTLLDSVSGKALSDLRETINEVKELLELEDLEGESDEECVPSELHEKLFATIEDADLQINFDDIVNIWSQSVEWINTAAGDANELETFTKGITALAETCALEMCKLHKIAELLLVKDHHSTANEVDSVVQLCKQFNIHLQGLANRFAATLATKQCEQSKTHVNTLFMETLVAKQHVEMAFKLFLPILQIGAI